MACAGGLTIMHQLFPICEHTVLWVDVSCSNVYIISIIGHKAHFSSDVERSRNITQ